MENPTIYFLLTLYLVSVSVTVYGTYLVLRKLAKRKSLCIDKQPAISILKPLKGLESGTRENLESFFQIRYPNYELLFSVADANDPVVSVVRHLQAHHPHVPSRLIIGDVQAGLNPKINNMLKSYHSAKHNWILISDSNVRVDSNYLNHVVEKADEKTGVITAWVYGVGSKSLGGHLEATYLNTFYMRSMALAYRFKRPIVIGKSMLFQKKVCERFGGLKSFGQFLAEDDAMGQAMRKLGYTVKSMTVPVYQYIGRYSFKKFWQRHLRWGRIRKSQVPVLFWIEPLFTCLVSGLLGAFAFSQLLPISFFRFLIFHFLFWALNDFLILLSLRRSLSIRWLGIWFLREGLNIFLWLHIASGKTVNWRGQKLQVEWGGVLTPLNKSSDVRWGVWQKWQKRFLTIFFGELRRVVIKSKVVMIKMTGGIGKLKATSKAVSVPELLAITGNDFEKISNLLENSA